MAGIEFRRTKKRQHTERLLVGNVLVIEGNNGKCGNNNQGTVMLDGSAYGSAGAGNDGTIIVKGGAGRGVGYSNKGAVIINEDVGDDVGFSNEGTIIIGGNTGIRLGRENKGTIVVLGDIKGLHSNASGHIYYGKSVGIPRGFKGTAGIKLEEKQIKLLKKIIGLN